MKFRHVNYAYGNMYPGVHTKNRKKKDHNM
jgi:hypothetical protein